MSRIVQTRQMFDPQNVVGQNQFQQLLLLSKRICQQQQQHNVNKLNANPQLRLNRNGQSLQVMKQSNLKTTTTFSVLRP